MRFDSQLSLMNCQMFSTGFNSGDFAGSGYVGRHGQRFRDVPSSLIENQDGVRARRNSRGDFFKMQGHRLGVAGGQDKRGAPQPSCGQIAPKI